MEKGMMVVCPMCGETMRPDLGEEDVVYFPEHVVPMGQWHEHARGLRTMREDYTEWWCLGSNRVVELAQIVGCDECVSG